ncbi:hypothetical protein B0H13DRAFT_1901579 [Mycena leptocephala]|nr:hypothetical protein B0H13DRAFT_1901579 [Mycena leptocephala]
MWATGARWGEAKSPSPRFKTHLPTQGDRAPPARKCPPGGGNAPPPDENGLRVELETASGGDYDISVDAPGQRGAAKSIQKLRGSDRVKAMKRREMCELSPSVYEGAGFTVRTDETGETNAPFRETCNAPLFRPFAAGSEVQRERRQLACCTKLKGKGTKSRQDARAAGRARQIRLGRRPRGCQSQSDGPSIHKHTRDRDARPSRPPRKTTPLTRREMPALQNLSHRNMCGPGWREQRSRRERAGDAMLFEDRPYVLVLGLLRLGFWVCLRGLGSVQRGG